MSPSRSRALTAVHDASWRLQDAGVPVDAAFVHAADQPNAPARAIAVAGGAAPVDSTVLIVDDHAPNVALLEELLRSAGINAVHGLTDGREVVSRCLELHPDLVLLDLHMPHMDGLDVLAALRAALPADTFLPVVVLTADGSADARMKALNAGAKDFLTKPLDHVETVLRVRNMLETGALYRALQGHSARLQAELDHRTEHDRRRSAERHARRVRVERVLHGDELSIVLQPILDLRGGRLVGVEALARFAGEPRRPPNEWFADAAEVGLGTELELAAVAAAVRRLPRLPGDAFVSINVSPSVALRADLDDVLAPVPGSRLVLELTEHTRIEDYGELAAALDRHRRRGVRIAVDDAGAGHAGLQQILRLRPDIIKLDLDLARDIHADPARRALAGALVTFGEEIGATVVAEGIETANELTALQALRVPWGQGYHLGRPGTVPADRPDGPRTAVLSPAA